MHGHDQNKRQPCEEIVLSERCMVCRQVHSQAEMMLTLRKSVIMMAAAALAALMAAAPSAAVDHTHVDNHLDTEIVATLSYSGGNSKFTGRRIPAGGSGASTASACSKCGHASC